MFKDGKGVSLWPKYLEFFQRILAPSCSTPDPGSVFLSWVSSVRRSIQVEKRRFTSGQACTDGIVRHGEFYPELKDYILPFSERSLLALHKEEK